jgi:cyanophycin synthetase
MKILSIRTIDGPNVFHHRPVLLMKLDLEELAETSSIDIPGFNERLLQLLPGLKLHHCSPGYEGGFVERLNRGTYFAHIIEHITLELSEKAGIGVTYGKSIYDGKPGRYKIAIRYKSEEGMTYLLKAAVELVKSISLNKNFDTAAFFVEAKVSEAKKIIADNALGPSTQAIINAAKKKNVPWKRLNDQGLIQLGYGKYRKFIQATTTSDTSDIAVDLAQNKFTTKRMLEEAFIKVPMGRPVDSIEAALKFLKKYGGPLVVKPLDGNHGRGITLNINSEEELIKAFEVARLESPDVLIEECLKGNDYRLVFVGGKLIAAAQRIPANVKGNGESTIQELVDKENKNPLRGEDHEKPLTKIHINHESHLTLKRQNLTLEDVPPKGMTVYLKETANISTGGCALDVTDEVHPEIRFMCERAAKIIGLDICGLDFIAEDITKPIGHQVAGIIEVNAGPGLRMHQHPSFGKTRDVGAAIIDNLFPENNGRIPIVAITGTNGKTTVSRILNHIFSMDGKCVGNTTSDGVYVDNKLIVEGDTTGPISAKAVLSDPMVDVAILETARGGIVKRGLAFDYCDVGIFTNVNADHIGQDGIETIEDIIKIKMLVIERVRQGGTIILNADVKEVAELAQNSKLDMKNKNLIFFTIDKNNPIFSNHLKNGGHGYFLKDQYIIEAQGPIESIVAHVTEIPITMNGTANFNVLNAMASIAAAHALQVTDEKILSALYTFNQDKNPGRTNLYKVKNGYVLMDYGHNPDAITAIGSMAREWNINSVTGVITAPGDRSDDMIKMLGLYASYAFDKIIIREDEDLRGRAQGEVAKLLKDIITKERKTLHCQVILDSRVALQNAINEMQENELVVFFYDDLESVDDILKESRASQDISPELFVKNKRLDIKTEQERAWLQHSH